MKSFFTRIQGFFSESYGGRYVEYILAELCMEDWRVGRGLFAGFRRGDELIVEWSFTIEERRRRADLAWVSGKTGEIKGLIELKYEDQKTDRISAQLADYIRYCNKDIQLLVLSQHNLLVEERKVLDKAGANVRFMLFSDLAKTIRTGSELNSLFYNYLKDKGLIMNSLNEKNIYNMLARLLLPYKGKGKKGQQTRVQSNPYMTSGLGETFSHLMQNLQIVSRELQTKLVGLDKREGALDFYLHPKYELKRDKAKSISNNNKIVEPEFNERIGGKLTLCARHALPTKKKNDWHYLEYAIEFQVKKGDDGFRSYLWCATYGNDVEWIIPRRRLIGNSVLSNESKLVEYLENKFIELRDIVKENEDIPGDRKRVVKKIFSGL